MRKCREKSQVLAFCVCSLVPLFFHPFLFSFFFHSASSQGLYDRSEDVVILDQEDLRKNEKKNEKKNVDQRSEDGVDVVISL